MTAPSRALLTGMRRLAPMTPRLRLIHSSTHNPAVVHPASANGPPPEPPMPADRSTGLDARIVKRRRQAEMLKRAQELRSGEKKAAPGASAAARASGLKRRFWKDCHVKEVDGAYQVHLDARPLRHPTTKEIVRIPLSKPQLAYALALEWDQLESAQQATRQHLIPLTSLTCRALDVAADDASTGGAIRRTIADTVLRYFDTDTLLCWAPHGGDEAADGRTLRRAQEDAARPVMAHLEARVWPGVALAPALDDAGLAHRPQAPGVRDVVRGWLLALDPWDLAGLERATLAGKSLLAAARLVAEWSPALRPADHDDDAVAAATAEKPFGVEDAARAVSVEVAWQTSMWGEVEDTHDVEKEDVRRHFGSVVLLVSGEPPM